MANNKAKKLEKLHRMQADYAAQLPGKVSAMDELWKSAQNEAEENESFATLKTVAHNLAGSAGTFGYADVGDIAKALELILSDCGDGARRTAGEIAAITALIAEIKELVRRQPKTERVSLALPVGRQMQKSPAGQLIYVVEDDELLAREIHDQLIHYGYEAEVFNDRIAAEAAMQKRSPVAMVVDLNLPEGPLAGANMIEQYKRISRDDVPLVFISARDDWAARLAVVRAGEGTYLTKPIVFGELLDRLELLTVQQDEEPYRVLLVDDDLLLANRYALALDAEGMSAKVVTEPSNLLIDISEFQPDLILMDVYMPSCSGLEAAAVIRQKHELLSTPIVFLSTEVNLRGQLEALQLGGDDFLQKPISDDHLVTAIKIRIQRFRNLRAYMQLDTLSGLLNHAALKMRLESEVQRALRQSSTLVFAMLDLDHFKNVNDSYGHPVGDEVIKSISRLLKQRLRKSDIVGRYGGEEFAVILPDTSLRSAQHVLDELREQFSLIKHQGKPGSFTCTVSVGLASVPPHRQVADLVRAADQALYAAKRRGRNCLCIDDEGGTSFGDESGNSEGVDAS